MPTVKELNISPVGRVEGDLDVKYIWKMGWHAPIPRPPCFVALNAYAGRDPQSGLMVTPRICGICGGSHLYCASA